MTSTDRYNVTADEIAGWIDDLTTDADIVAEFARIDDAYAADPIHRDARNDFVNKEAYISELYAAQLAIADGVAVPYSSIQKFYHRLRIGSLAR